MAKLWQFSQGQPKPAFSEKVQRRNQRKFFKHRLKSTPWLKGLKALWRKKALSCMQNADKFQRLEKILAQTAAPEVPAWPSYGNFRKVTQNPQFLKKWKGETRGYFSKFAQKVAVV